MSNAKLIQKKVTKIQMKQFRNMLHYISKIDTRPVTLALEKIAESLSEIANTANKIKVNYEQF